MLLSVVVPTYNVEEYLSNCLDSLLRQDLIPGDYEILVINDGSTDKSGEIADNYAVKHSNIRVIHQANRGLSGARNTGIQQAVGKYIFFIDSDDYISDNTLRYVLSISEQYSLDVLGLGVKDTEHLNEYDCENLDEFRGHKIKVQDGIKFIANHNYMNNAWWYIVRKDHLIRTGLEFPIGRFVEDANFTAQLLASAQKIAFVPIDFYRYVVRPASIMRKKDKAHIRRLIEDYKKNVFDFNEQINSLKSENDHPGLTPCIQRLTARMESFVFFGIIKALRNGYTPRELQEYIADYRKIGAYPIEGFIGKDYGALQYRILTPLLNRKWTLYLLARFYPS